MSKGRRPRRPSEKKKDDDDEDHPLDGLKRWTTLAPERFSYAWARGGKEEEEVRRLTARDMSSRLKKIRGELERKFEATRKTKKTVVFMYEPGIEWFPVFLALMSANIAPCVAHPIDPMTTSRCVLKEKYEFLKMLAKECSGVVCSPKMATALKLTRLKLLDAQGLGCEMWVVDGCGRTEDVSAEENVCDDEKEPVWRRDPETPAFIQYTSGSTGKPKGVILSHRALTANCTAIREGFKTSPYDSLCSWLPQYHDMGLIGGFFVPLTIASGYDAIDFSLLPKKGTCVFISPIDFVKDPSVWIHLMSKYESTMTQAPDFAFALAARKFSASDARNAETLRLHSLRHVLNASEPVRSQTVNDFLDVFQRYGLKKSSLRVGYGLAEVCVYATEHPVEFFRANRDALESGDMRMAKEAKNGEPFIEVACIGVNSHKHFKILNFDSESEVKTPGQVGRVVLTNTRSICSGYVNDEIRTRATFNFNRNEIVTGDEGFVLQDGRVFILGRIVDILDVSFFANTIRNGTWRIQANEFERVALAGPLCSIQNLVRKGSASAFGVGKHESTKIVLVVEVSDAFLKSESVKSKELRREIERKVVETYGEFSGRRFEVLLTYPRSTPRTTSGKVRRFAVRRKYSEGGIEVITDEDDDDKDTEDESNNNLDEIDKLVLDVVKENVRDIRTAGTPLLGATSVQFTQIQIEITKRLESEKLLEITLDTYQLLSCTNARDITVLVKRAMGKNDYGEYFNDSNIIATKTVTPTNNRFPSVRFTTLFVILFAAQHHSNQILDEESRQQLNAQNRFYDNRAAEWLYVLVPFQVVFLLLHNLVIAVTRAKRYESINLVGVLFGLTSCIAMHGISKASWLILSCMIAYKFRKLAPRLFRKPSFVWSVASLSFAAIAKLERNHTSAPMLAASGRIDSTGSLILDGIYGNTSFHIFRASRYVVLRVVDYYLSSATAVDQNATDDNMLLFLHYVFFAPLFQCGPLVRGGFDVFSKRIKSSPWTRRFNANKRSMTKRVVWRFTKDALDLFVWFLISNFLATSQTILSAPPTSSLSLLSKIVRIFATSRAAFGLGRAIAHAMHFTDVADDTPLFLYDCLANFSSLWWNFHVSFRDFFARNIYSKHKNQHFSVALTFFISACFHDVSFTDHRWLYFFVANTSGVLVERALFATAAAQARESNRLLKALNTAVLWSLLIVVGADGTIEALPHASTVPRYAYFFVKTVALSLLLSHRHT